MEKNKVYLKHENIVKVYENTFNQKNNTTNTSYLGYIENKCGMRYHKSFQVVNTVRGKQLNNVPYSNLWWKIEGDRIEKKDIRSYLEPKYYVVDSVKKLFLNTNV